MKCVQVLLPALIDTDERKQQAELAEKSIVAFDHCVKLTIDNNKYKEAVARAWNIFLDKWRGKKYDYLMIMASDVQLDPNAIDFMIKCLESNPKAGIVSAKVTRDIEDFRKNFGQIKYSNYLTRTQPKDPATFILRKGVIEKVGRIDEEFPMEFVERDFLYRCKLAGYDWIQPDITLCFHPPYAGTIGNDHIRLHNALNKYVLKWGGDADSELYIFPYNNIAYNFTYCKR